ncbi:hypothetical protein CRG98_017095 [Punica granatum]|uniref:Sulfotransferase n=1 Tax=Punica granatum TaxID=22663 RepID=A0A2I0K1N4_PUNGR|nr:hypothetical protein CRG98_017095 [Punica granatum]
MPAPSEPPLPKYLQDENLTDECRELLRSLQSEKGWLSTFLHLFQGFWYPTRHMNGVLYTQRQFRAQDSDVLLVTTPKSGTTWLKAILFALLNRFHYLEPHKKPDHPLLRKNPHDLVPFLELRLYVEDPNPDLSSFTSSRLFATHLSHVSLPDSVKDSKCKLVYLCRNPKDTFDNLSKLEVNRSGKLPTGEENRLYFRKGEVGDWVNYLTPEMIERLDCITEEKFRGSGLKL